MTKIHLDIPNNFMVSTYIDHLEVKRVYDSIISSALQLGAEITLNKSQPHLDNIALRRNSDKGIYYSYHSRVKDRHSYCIKGSAIPNLWYFDKSGYSGWAEIANNSDLQKEGETYCLEKANKTIYALKNKFLYDGFSRLKQTDSKLPKKILELPQFVFFPMQLCSDEVLKLSEFSQIEIIEALLEIAKKNKQHIVLKRHPLCSSSAINVLLDRVKSHPWVHISDSSIHKLIPASQSVLVINSGVGMQALIHGKHVFSLAPSEYSHISQRIDLFSQLEYIFTPSDVQDLKKRQQLGYLLNEYLIDVYDSESLNKRINNHILKFNTETKNEDINFSSSTTPLSILHSAKKQLLDNINLLLLDYKNLQEADKEKVTKILLRSARSNFHTNKILRYTNISFLQKLITLLIKDKNFNFAENLIRERIKKEAHPCEEHKLLSMVLFHKGKNTEGLAEAKLAADYKNAPIEVLTFYSRKLLSTKKDDTKEALNIIRKALKIEPNNIMANYVLARIMLIEKNHHEALKICSKVLLIDPQNKMMQNLEKKIQEKP